MYVATATPPAPAPIRAELYIKAQERVVAPSTRLWTDVGLRDDQVSHAYSGTEEGITGGRQRRMHAILTIIDNICKEWLLPSLINLSSPPAHKPTSTQALRNRESTARARSWCSYSGAVCVISMFCPLCVRNDPAPSCHMHRSNILTSL